MEEVASKARFLKTGSKDINNKIHIFIFSYWSWSVCLFLVTLKCKRHRNCGSWCIQLYLCSCLLDTVTEGANLCSRCSVSNALPFTNTRHSQPAYLKRMVELMIAVPIRFCSTPGTGNIRQNLLDQQLSGLCLVVRLATHPSNPPKFQFGDQLHLKSTRGLAISAMVKRWLWATATVSAALAVHGALRGHLRRAAAAALTAVLLAHSHAPAQPGNNRDIGGTPSKVSQAICRQDRARLDFFAKLRSNVQTYRWIGR